MTKYFLIGASRDHVLGGVAGGFAQAGHGRKDLMSQPAKGDWVVFYSAKDKLEGGTPWRKFTAIGQIADAEPYQPEGDSSCFRPYRRDVVFEPAGEADIYPLLPKLQFIKNKGKWGFYLRSGFRQVSKEDFETIRSAMT